MSLPIKWQQSAGTLVRDKHKCKNEGHACLSLITRPHKGPVGMPVRHIQKWDTRLPLQDHTKGWYMRGNREDQT